tara:strand:+ start:2167 stop:3015 length:849 start_codon:yes stop_codon:yes gene_type:complete
MLDSVGCIFAHNESKTIVESIKSLVSQGVSDIYVMINGCSDNTYEIVKKYSKENPSVKAIQISLGDKSNAWNVFVHDINIASKHYYFLDGDCFAVPGAVKELRSLCQQKECNAVAATPYESTKNRQITTKVMLSNGGLAGNLYLLSHDFVERVRGKSVRLPVGCIGEDGLVGALAYWNLKPFSDWDKNNVAVAEHAKFDYKPLSKFDIDDLKLYYRRKIRYSCRYFQNKIITEAFRDKGLEGISKNFSDLYLKYDNLLKLKYRGLDTYFDWLALRRIKAGMM